MSALIVDLRRLMAMVAEEVSRASSPAGLVPPGSGEPGTLAGVIDHTLLTPDATACDIDRLCREALEYRFATVCVNPVWVRRCAAALRGSATGVTAVVGFPFGASVAELKAAEARRAMADGATEIDMVLNIGALRNADHALVYRDIAAVAAVTTPARRCLKVILETGYLDDTEKVAACVLAAAAGADFVKTSTGFGPGGATVDDVVLMRRVVGAGVGVKASGGVRDAAGARAMLAAGANRIGSSASLAIVQGDRGV